MQPKDGHNLQLFPPKSEQFFRFSDKGTEDLSLSTPNSCTPVSVDEYASISLNVSKYP